MEVNEADQHSSEDIENQNDEIMDSGGIEDDESSDGYIESDSDVEGLTDCEDDECHGGEADGDRSEDEESGIDVTDVETEDRNDEKDTKTPKKIAPHKQKPIIHTLLKRAKIYEIRKLTRRSNVLKSAKGTEEQQAKKQRKAERFRKEIEAIRAFMIDQLTERTVNAFKGKSDVLYNDMWKACEDPIKINDMIQMLSNKGEENFSDIAYFRMLSSKDVLTKFQRIAGGENLSTKQKNKRRGYKTNRKNAKGKRMTKKKKKETDNEATEAEVDKENVESNTDPFDENESVTTDKKVTINTDNSKVEKEIKRKENKRKLAEKTKSKVDTETIKNPKVNKKKVKATIEKKRSVKKDDFFMDHTVEVTDDENSTEAEDNEEEFTAPVKYTENPAIVSKKKNRMGQRDRKRLQDIKHGRPDPRKMNNSRGRGDSGLREHRGRGGMTRGRGRGFTDRSQNINNFRGKTGIDSKNEKKEVDKSLHPSWQAKQRQKNQQIIGGFSGTKITFDD